MELEEVEKYVGGDKIFSPAWMVLQITLAIISSIIVFALNIEKITFNFLHSKIYYYGFHTYTQPYSYYTYPYHLNPLSIVSSIVFAVSEILNIYILSVLISRRNFHFERTSNLYTAISKVFEGRGFKKEAWKIKEYVKRCEVETGKKNVAGWVVLSLIPLVNLFAIPYIYHFLTRDFFKHSKYEELIYDTFSEIFNRELETEIELETYYPDRDTVMYFLLSVATAGIAGIYWYYTLFSDPNKHFKEHSIAEEKLIQCLSKLFPLP